MKNIFLQIPVSSLRLSQLAIATVTATTGSTPQKPGSSALFDKNGLVCGTIGGGILEGSVQQMSIQIIAGGKPVLHSFNLDNSVSGGEDALCGGRITILIEPLSAHHTSVIEAIRKSAEEKVPGVLISRIGSAANGSADVKRYWMTAESVPDIASEYRTGILSAAAEILSSQAHPCCREVKLPVRENGTAELFFFEPLLPPPSLVIAGAGHIGKVLARLGQMLDFDVTVIDDRKEYANTKNIPEADRILTGEIGKLVAGCRPDSNTYIVIVTRGHRDDAEALRACIGSGARYIGMIGSKNKIALMRDNFLTNGWATIDQWDRLYAPVGIDIESKTVEEIAVSIAAQLVKVRNSMRKVS